MEDWSSKAILAQNSGGQPATYKSWTGDCEATCSGPIGLAETHGNGYVFSDTLLKKNILRSDENQANVNVFKADHLLKYSSVKQKLQFSTIPSATIETAKTPSRGVATGEEGWGYRYLYPPQKKISPSKFLWGKNDVRTANQQIYTPKKLSYPPKQISGYAPDSK